MTRTFLTLYMTSTFDHTDGFDIWFSKQNIEIAISPEWTTRLTWKEYDLNWLHDDVIKWKHFPRYWQFVRRIHRSPVNFPHKCQWRGALMFSLNYIRINSWVNNGEAGDLTRHRAHYDVTVLGCWTHYLIPTSALSYYFDLAFTSLIPEIVVSTELGWSVVRLAWNERDIHWKDVKSTTLLWLLNQPMAFALDFKMKFWKSHNSGMNSNESCWFVTSWDMNKNMKIKP